MTTEAAFDNPLAEGLDTVRRAPPGVLVVFGASGDLTHRKLLPALERLSRRRLLPAAFAVIGIARTEMSDDAFRDVMVEAVPGAGPGWAEIVKNSSYITGDYAHPGTFSALAQRLGQVDEALGTGGTRTYYLATVPDVFAEVARMLGQVKLNRPAHPGATVRLVIEKPFGHDRATARQLDAALHEVFDEEQIYRIDHYLGKETVQNVMVFRFSNNIIEPLWNRHYIDHVQITAAETVGVEHRGGFYETAGALRDMVPNHLFQLLTMTAMEPPISFDADEVRNKQAEILHAIQPLTPEEVITNMVRGQYGAGEVNGERVEGYRSEPDVNPQSNTETFVALKLQVDNWRWAGVPFYLRTGKSLAKRATEIVIQFRRTPFVLFRHTTVKNIETNRMVIHIQPDEGISLSFGAKVPGSTMRLGLVNMDFDYDTYFGTEHSTGYERLLRDCMVGDATLFQRADMVEAGWSVIQPILDVWHALPARSFPNYAAGSWGPAEADELLARDGRAWRRIGEEDVDLRKINAEKKVSTA